MLSRLSVEKFLADKPLALTVAGYEELKARIESRLALFDEDKSAFLAAVAASTNRAAPQPGRPRSDAGTATGIIQVRGTISQHADPCSDLIGGSSTEGIAQELRDFLADDSISKIVLDIDSPGGIVAGAPELFQEIFQSRGQKPIIGVANAMAASKAYWLAAACDQIFITPSGMVGSIGVYTMHQDISKAADEAGIKTTIIKAGKFKAMGNQWEPLSEDALGRIQAQVDEIYDQFVSDVARGRGVPAATVRNGFGEGDIVSAKNAKAESMVDGIKTLEQVIGMTFKVAEPGRGPKAEAEELETEEDKSPTPEDVESIEAQARMVRMRRALFQARATAGAA